MLTVMYCNTLARVLTRRGFLFRVTSLGQAGRRPQTRLPTCPNPCRRQFGKQHELGQFQHLVRQYLLRADPQASRRHSIDRKDDHRRQDRALAATAPESRQN